MNPVPLNPLDDEKILVDFKNGEKYAFKLIIDRFHAALLCWSEEIVSDKQAAEDIVTDTLYKLFHARGEFESIPHIKRRVYMIARNTMIDYLRSMKNDPDMSRSKLRSLTQEELENYLDLGITKWNLFQGLLERSKLSDSEKKILDLHYGQGKAIQEIGRVLHLGLSEVIQQKQAALHTLSQLVYKRSWLN